jgi:hypothetical protein
MKNLHLYLENVETSDSLGILSFLEKKEKITYRCFSKISSFFLTRAEFKLLNNLEKDTRLK